MSRFFLALLAGLALLGCTSAPGILELDSGPVLLQADGVYKGIPYAAPPVGDLRWRPPAPPMAWSEPRRFDSFGPACPQPDPDGPCGEDCLSLNVWTPAKKPGDRLPVMVFIHGGAFAAGAGTLDMYDGSALAGDGAVAVTINYRLGLPGWMAHPLLSAENGGASGNYGLMDQIAALEWVRRNIAAFGGDPGNVTVFGQSAGAESVALLLVCPRAEGLFHRAILQSPALPGSLRHLREERLGVAPAEAVGQLIAQAAGRGGKQDVLDALRNMPLDTLDRAAASLPGDMAVELAGLLAGPVVDGVLIPDHPLALFRAGRFHRVPLMVGVTADEGSLFMPLAEEAAASREGFRARMERLFGADAGEAGRLALGEDGDTWAATQRVLSARWFESFAVFLARIAPGNGVPAWFYRFTRPIPEEAAQVLAEDSGAGDVPHERFGVPHGAELFGLFGFTPWYLGFSQADRDMGRTMRGYWVNFARTGHPGGEGGAAWPAFDPARPRMMEFGEAARAADLPPDPLRDLAEKGWLTTTY